MIHSGLIVLRGCLLQERSDHGLVGQEDDRRDAGALELGDGHWRAVLRGGRVAEDTGGRRVGDGRGGIDLDPVLGERLVEELRVEHVFCVDDTRLACLIVHRGVARVLRFLPTTCFPTNSAVFSAVAMASA
jgi:hypothetical protein